VPSGGADALWFWLRSLKALLEKERREESGEEEQAQGPSENTSASKLAMRLLNTPGLSPTLADLKAEEGEWELRIDLQLSSIKFDEASGVAH